MCTRYSILLVLSGGIFVYGLLYNYMYAPNVVRDAPVAVVDMSRTPLSRSYIRLLDATPQARVLTNNADLPAAKELMKYDEVVGIVYIPADFDARVGRGEEAIYIMYSTTTAFLYFASMQEASAGAMLAVNDDVRPEQKYTAEHDRRIGHAYVRQGADRRQGHFFHERQEVDRVSA